MFRTQTAIKMLYAGETSSLLKTKEASLEELISCSRALPAHGTFSGLQENKSFCHRK